MQDSGSWQVIVKAAAWTLETHGQSVPNVPRQPVTWKKLGMLCGELLTLKLECEHQGLFCSIFSLVRRKI